MAPPAPRSIRYRCETTATRIISSCSSTRLLFSASGTKVGWIQDCYHLRHRRLDDNLVYLTLRAIIYFSSFVIYVASVGFNETGIPASLGVSFISYSLSFLSIDAASERWSNQRHVHAADIHLRCSVCVWHCAQVVRLPCKYLTDVKTERSLPISAPTLICSISPQWSIYYCCLLPFWASMAVNMFALCHYIMS